MKSKLELIRSSEDTFTLLLPNTWNCIQSAIWELNKLEPQPQVNKAISYLENAKKSLDKVRV